MQIDRRPCGRYQERRILMTGHHLMDGFHKNIVFQIREIVLLGCSPTLTISAWLIET